MKNLCTLILLGATALFGLDIVIPVHKKDAGTIGVVIDKLKKYVTDAEEFYVISKEPVTDKAHWIDEALFPFTIGDVGNELGGKGGIGNHIRRGWYYQQLLKFYVAKVEEKLSDHFLIMDADTLPTHPMRFVEEDRFYLDYLKKSCSIIPYYTHMKDFIPELSLVNRNENPVVHHMVFSKAILDDLFDKVEDLHNKPLWKAFCNIVRFSERPNSRGFYAGASEYMIYYHFCLHFYPEMVIKREIVVNQHAKSLLHNYPTVYDFISHHNYDRTE